MSETTAGQATFQKHKREGIAAVAVSKDGDDDAQGNKKMKTDSHSKTKQCPKKCPHNRQKAQCKECGGSQVPMLCLVACLSPSDGSFSGEMGVVRHNPC